MKKLIVSLLTVFPMLLVALPAFAQTDSGSSNLGVIAMAAGLCMGVAAFGGALGQGRTAAAAVEGIARNPQAAPKVQTPMIIALAMTESLVLFSFVIAFILQGKVS